MGSSKEPDVINTIEDGVRIVRLNRPKKLNAFSTEMFNSLKEFLIEAGNDPKTVITVITGTGDYFTSGNDLKNFTKIDTVGSETEEFDLSTEEGRISMLRKKGVSNFERFIDILIDFPKPIIAVVNGPAVGIGTTMLGLMDAVYASDKATFHTPFTKIAVSPEGCSSYLFPRIMGPGKAAEMLLFSKKITAEEACRCGLVTEVFPHEKLSQVWPRIREWAKLPPNSLANAKVLTRAHIKEELKKVNDFECGKLAERFTKDEFTTVLMENFSRKQSKL